MVDTSGVNWIENQRDTKMHGSFEGHVFVEIFLQKKWLLVDSTTGEYIVDYNPGNPWIPIAHDNQTKGYLVMKKGIDSWAYGIKNLDELQALQIEHARMTDPSKLTAPKYKIESLDSY